MRESCFAVGLAGWTVCLPPGTPLEYVARTAVYPVPLAPGQMAGLMQLRGQPVVVFDVRQLPAADGSGPMSPAPSGLRSSARPAPATGAGIPHGDVLVIGTLPQATALLIDSPPWPVPETRLRGRTMLPDGAPATCPFRAAIVSRCIARVDEADGEAGRQSGVSAGVQEGEDDWYEIDPDGLFEILSTS